MRRTLRLYAVSGMAAVRELFVRLPAYRWLVLSCLVLAGLAAFLPAWKIFPKATEGLFVPLHYNIYFGVDQFGPWEHLFAPAVFGVAIVFVNIVVAAATFRTSRVIAWYLLGLSLFVEMVLLVASAFMVLLNL